MMKNIFYVIFCVFDSKFKHSILVTISFVDLKDSSFTEECFKDLRISVV